MLTMKRHRVQTITGLMSAIWLIAPLCAQPISHEPTQSDGQQKIAENKKLHSTTQAPVTLRSLFESALQTYPALQASRLDARAAAQETDAVKRGRWPSISAVLESDTGDNRNLPSKSLQIEQTLWDFGRLNARIEESQSVANAALANIYVKQQELYLQITSNWYAMLGAKERLQAAQATYEQLQHYQAQMQRRVEAQASPQIDLELVQARLLQTQVELTTAQTSMQVAITRLEQLTAEENLNDRLTPLKLEINPEKSKAFKQHIEQISWAQIAAENPQVEKVRLEAQQIKNRFEAKKSEAWPQIYLRVTQPMGTVPPVYTSTNPSAFVGLRYTPGAGLANLIETQAMATRMASSEQLIESAMREIQQTLQNDQEDYINASNRMQALQNAVQGADLVHQSYKRQFEAGKKSWIDLLNAVRELAQNRYTLAEAKATMLAAKSRLQIRMNQDPQ